MLSKSKLLSNSTSKRSLGATVLQPDILGHIMRYERVADRIVIEQSRKGAIILVVLFLVIIIGWQWVVLGMPKNLQELRALDKGFVGNTGINPIFLWWPVCRCF